MQHLFEIADKIPWIMAPAAVIFATIVISVLFSLRRMLQPASKAMLVAVMLAMSAWAIMMRAFWRNSNLLILPFLLALTAFCSTSTWALCGAATRKHLHQPRVRVLVNAVFVLLLVYTAIDLSGIASVGWNEIWPLFSRITWTGNLWYHLQFWRYHIFFRALKNVDMLEITQV